MSLDTELLRQMDICWGMNDEELQLLQEVADIEEYDIGDIIFREEDDDGSLYFVLEGVVEILTHIGGGVERTLSEIRSGAEFGEMSLIDDAPRSASARASAKTRLFSVKRDSFLDLIEKSPSFAAKALINLSRTLSKRLRTTTEELRQSIDWDLKISGATALNLGDLIHENRNLRIRLQGQEELSGSLLKVDRSNAGYELTLQDKKGKLFIIPYHAVVYICVEENL